MSNPDQQAQSSCPEGFTCPMTNPVEAIKNRLASGDEKFDDLRTMIENISAKQDQARRDLGDVKEMIQAWNNAKGFISTVRAIAKFLAIIGVILGFLYAIYQFGRTGQWTPPPAP